MPQGQQVLAVCTTAVVVLPQLAKRVFCPAW